MEAVVRKEHNLTRTSLFIRAEQLEQLRSLSAQTGAAIAFMVRQAIELYLDEHRCQARKIAPMESPACGPNKRTIKGL
jgi:hypothetical protein